MCNRRLNQNLLEHNLPSRRGKKTFLEQAAFYRLSLLRKLEVGNQKSEVRSRKSEVGSWKTLFGFRNFGQIQVERQFCPTCHALCHESTCITYHAFAPVTQSWSRLAQMAPDDGDALLKKVRAQHRSVSFITASELVNIDVEDESHRNEESELNETVRKLFYNELMMFSIFI